MDEVALTVLSTNGVPLLLNDILANVQNAKGINGIVAWVFGFSGKQPQIPFPEKVSTIDDKAALAAQFRAWAIDPRLIRIIVSHGNIIEGDPRNVLLDVARALT